MKQAALSSLCLAITLVFSGHAQAQKSDVDLATEEGARRQAHKIELDRGRVDRRIEELVAPYEKPQEAAQLYRSSRELMGQVESAVLEDQVVDFLLARGKVKDKDSTFDEFMGMGVSK